MRYRPLGQSGIEVSELGFGCMSLTGDQAASKSLLQAAMEKGFNFFDTADLYNKGLNERMLGKAIKGKRAQCIIATKVGNKWLPDGKGWEWCPSRKYIMEAVEESLQRLDTDYIDLYQLHGGTLEDPIDDVIETFELLVQQGKIRFYGISSIRPNVIREYAERSRITSVMMQYSILDRRPEEGCFDLLRQKKISVLARGSLAKGLLLNKKPAGYLGLHPEMVQHAASVLRTCSRMDRNIPQTALQFVLNEPVIASAVVGLRTLGQLEEVSGTSEVQSLSLEELGRLRNAVPVLTYDMHR